MFSMASTWTEPKDAGSTEALLDGDQFEPVRLRSKTPWLLYSIIAVLALGWITTAAGYWNLMMDTRPPPTPIPKDVFIRKPKVFQRDERYIGPSLEAKRHWDDLVAGTKSKRS